MSSRNLLFAAAAFALPAAWAQQSPQPAQPPQPPRARSAGGMSLATPYLGVGIMGVDEARARALKMNEARGAEITQITPGGPAEKAGLKVNDVVLEYDGQRVESQDQLQRLVRQTAPGHAVKLGVWRNGAMIAVNVTVELHREPQPAVGVATPRGPWGVGGPDFWPFDAPMPMPIPQIQTVMQSSILGVQCESLGDEQQFAEYFGVKDGLLVKAVAPDSPAARGGIKAGDVIVKIDETHVGTMRELTLALRSILANQKSSYQATVVRNKKEIPLTLSVR